MRSIFHRDKVDGVNVDTQCTYACMYVSTNNSWLKWHVRGLYIKMYKNIYYVGKFKNQRF